jgi:hypothetical protein
MIINWGKPDIEVADVAADGTVGAYTKWPTPAEDTTQLTTELGDELSANEEGGEPVDKKRKKGTAFLELSLFVKKGEARPVEDVDGIVAGHKAVRIIPSEDDECEGRSIEKATLTMTETWNSAEGSRLKYRFDALKPKAGAMVKPYTAGGLVVTPALLYFGSAADTTGKTITVTSTANPVATSSESWCTTSVAGKVVTVKATANTGTEAREAVVTITADGKMSKVKVTQIPA